MEFTTHSKSLSYLKEDGIKVLEYTKVCVGVDEVLNAICEIGEKGTA